MVANKAQTIGHFMSFNRAKGSLRPLIVYFVRNQDLLRIGLEFLLDAFVPFFDFVKGRFFVHVHHQDHAFCLLKDDLGKQVGACRLVPELHLECLIRRERKLILSANNIGTFQSWSARRIGLTFHLLMDAKSLSIHVIKIVVFCEPEDDCCLANQFFAHEAELHLDRRLVLLIKGL